MKTSKALGLYLEWSGIARTVIKNRSVLRRLGFLRRTSAGSLEEEMGDELQEQADHLTSADTPPGGVVISALPAANNGALPPASNGASVLSQAALQ